MTVKYFTPEQLEILLANPNVVTASSKAITYSVDFKMKFIEEYELGKSPSRIFEEAGFDVQVLGTERIKTATFRWKKAVKNDGTLGLRDTRKVKSGRPLKRTLTPEEQIAKLEAENLYLKGELDFIKKLELSEKGNRTNKLTAELTFSLIEELSKKSSRSISLFCRLAGVSRSGYYAYKKRSFNVQKQHRELVLKKTIEQALAFRSKDKGTRSIVMTLKNTFGIIMNRKCVQRICRKFGLLSSVRKANPYRRLAKATKEHSVVENKLKRAFKPGIAGKVLLTDITYLPYGNQAMAYLSTVKDAQTNEILAYQLSNNLKIDFVLNTMTQLVEKHGHRLDSEVLIHSDQGSHYTSPKFQKLMKSFGITQSMSRRGNCWDNAPQESFFGHMKDECDFDNCQSYKEVQSLIDDYMDYYNNDRGQWNLKKLAPIDYRYQLIAA